MAIDQKHPDYINKEADWKLVDDITRKKNLKEYLIELNPLDTSANNKKRNEQYKKRAIFYAVAAQTCRGLVGTMFRKWPTLKVPTALDYIKKNADGAGNSIYQQSQAVADDVIRKSRAGLCTSYPNTNGQTASKADMAAMKVYATIHRFEPEQILNWATTVEGANIKLSLVVLSETEEELDEHYEVTSTETIRELFLDADGVYNERKWVKGKEGWEIKDEWIPKDGNGNVWSEIPFTFLGSESNDVSVDDPNMYDLCQINIGHYRNSADYEDNVWFCGQSQPWMSGLTQEHIDLLNANHLYFGSRNMMGVPAGEQMGILTAAPNPLVRQGMIDKLEMMIGMGARFLQPGSAVKTATQAEGDLDMQHSVLSLIANNLTDAYTLALKWVARFMKVVITDDELQYIISQDFVRPRLEAQELQAMVAAWLQGAVPDGDLWNWMRKREIIDPEKTDDEISNELPPRVEVPDLSGDVDSDDDSV